MRSVHAWLPDNVTAFELSVEVDGKGAVATAGPWTTTSKY